jgi:type I restriction enzyme M protein
MTGYPCEDCEHVFSLKSDLERHRNKKTPCIPKEKIISNHATEVVEKINNTEQINKVKKFLDFCHDMLRDKEGIVMMKALSNISMLLFLKFISNSVKSGSIDLLNIEKYRKEDGTHTDEKFQQYKDYIKYVQFDNIVENGKLKVDSTELPIIIEYIFRHIIWHHPKTKNIFIDEIPSIKNDITYEQIFKQMDKLNWDDMDIDIKGLAYEYFLKDEMGGGDLGQFFTKREIVDYIIKIIKPHIKETSTFIDPFMGTGGFITHIYNELKSFYKKNKIPFTDEIKNNLINGIEKNPQTCLLALNNLLINMDMYPTNVKCGDSFRNYMKYKYDFVLTNPPFGIKGLTYDNKTMFPDKINGIKKEEYLPIKSNDAICLAIQMIQYILNKNGIGAIIVPDGKQLSNTKEKAMINMRKMLIENNNLFQITKLPSGSFLPYTAVETSILFFKKGEKTNNIKFVKLNDKYDIETTICNVRLKNIQNNNYSLNYKLYVNTNKNIHANLNYQKIEDIFTIISSKKQVSKITEGEYKFVSMSNNKFSNEYTCDGENIFISNVSPVGKMYYYNGKCDFASILNNLKLINANENIKYYYYYLLFNYDKISENYQKGAANKTLDLEFFKKMEIPVPPIEVQNLIVKELDSYYKIKDSNQNILDELEVQRKGKFELLLDLCENKKETKLGEIVNFKSGKFNSGDKKKEGKYKFFTSDAVQPSGYYDEYCFEGKKYIILIKDGGSGSGIYGENIGLGKVFLLENEKTSATSHQLALYFDDTYKKQINYIFHYLKIQKNQIMDLAHYTNGLGCISIEKLKNLNIIIPSIEDQEAIIKEMEYFDNLKEAYQTHIVNTEKQIKERFEYHLNKCKNVVPKDTNESKDDNVDSETDADEEEKIVKRTKSSKSIKSKKDVESYTEDEKPIKKTKSTKSKVEKELETDTEDEKPIKKSSKKINKSTKNN